MAITNTTVQLTTITCWVCGVYFGVPFSFERKREEDGRTFYCPNGDRISYGPSLLDQERKRRESAEARVTHERDQRQAAERSASAYKGRVTRLKNRIANGVCPCCNRTFQDLQRHMSNQHPDFRQED